jgi:hypothetical protein
MSLFSVNVLLAIQNRACALVQDTARMSESLPEMR